MRAGRVALCEPTDGVEPAAFRARYEALVA